MPGLQALEEFGVCNVQVLVVGVPALLMSLLRDYKD